MGYDGFWIKGSRPRRIRDTVWFPSQKDILPAAYDVVGVETFEKDVAALGTVANPEDQPWIKGKVKGVYNWTGKNVCRGSHFRYIDGVNTIYFNCMSSRGWFLTVGDVLSCTMDWRIRFRRVG